ncbi:CinA family protein [Pararhizobium mangrovi]|uniref:CinA family protein n=1 Tax=Pararhizobium mangrovi TaxID=2590452 RepID=A0A506UAE7_9HYPH|nr:CinA family protein [Pararhizobium mangrovi]TPW31353.1 CinA family protein [Pararhizobium mangrovi]
MTIDHELARNVVACLESRGVTLATVESCTGGMIAAAITDVAGASHVFERGFVTYSNAAKVAMVGVREATLDRYGAVSREVAIEMAEGALAVSPADASVSVTGVAGPGGGSVEKPVGLVHVALAMRGRPTHHEELRFGDLGRATIRVRTVSAALLLIVARIGDQPPFRP